MSFCQFYDDSNVILELESSSKEDALKEMVELLAKTKRITKKLVEPLLKAVIERESQGATGIGKGVALPHAKSSEIKKITTVLARSSQGIDFDAADNRPVSIFFLVLSPESAPEDHIKFLRWISSLAREADFRSFILQAQTKADIHGLLVEFGGGE